MGGVARGLTRKRGEEFASIPMPEGLRQTGIRTIVEDAQGRIWARTRPTSLRRPRRPPERWPATRARWRSGADGVPRVTTPEGIARPEGDRLVVLRPVPPVRGEAHPFSVLAATLTEADGTMWFGAPWGLGRLQTDGGWTVFTAADGLPGAAVTSLGRDREGTVWVGTTHGLVRVRGGRPVAEGRHPLLGPRIDAIYEDGEGSLWIGTDTDGVHQLRNGAFTPLTTEDGLSDDLVMPIRETADGSVWIGTARGLNRVRGSRIETFTTADGLPDDGVFSLAEDAAGRLWIGSRRGPLTVFASGPVSGLLRAGPPRPARPRDRARDHPRRHRLDRHRRRRALPGLEGEGHARHERHRAPGQPRGAGVRWLFMPLRIGLTVS